MNSYYNSSVLPGTPSRKISNPLQTPTNKITTGNVQYQSVTSVPTYSYMTMTQAPTTATVVTTSTNPLTQSNLRYSQQFVNAIPVQQQASINGQHLGLSSLPPQIQQQNINTVTSPKYSTVQATSPTNTTSDIAQSIINKYKNQQQTQNQPQFVSASQSIQQYQSAPTPMMSPIQQPSSIQGSFYTPAQATTNNQTVFQKAVVPAIDIPLSSPTYALPQSPVQARFFQTESSTKTSTISQQNVPSYIPYGDASRNASNYISATSNNQQAVQNVQMNTSQSHPHFTVGLSHSYNHLNTSQVARDNLSKIPDKVSDKLLEEFQKLTETNLKFFMSNKQKWKEIESSLKHENEDLKQKISMLHESYSQINRSMTTAHKPEISFSLQKDLDLANIYEQKVLSIQQELERSNFELEQYRKKNAQTEQKNDELNLTCQKLNDQIHSAMSKSVEGKLAKIDEAKIEEIKNQYEIKIIAEKELYTQQFQSMSNQIAVLETSLTNEKATTQKLQSDILNMTSDQLLSSKYLDSKFNLDTNNNNNNNNIVNDNKVYEIQLKYEAIISSQKEQFNADLQRINGQISELETNLTKEKIQNQQLQNEILNLSTALQGDQSRFVDGKNILDQSVLDTKIQEVKQEYEVILSTQKNQFTTELNRMTGQLSTLEYQLQAEKTTTQKLQNEIHNISIQQVNLDSSKIYETQVKEKENELQELKKHYEQALSNQKSSYDQAVINMNGQIVELENHLAEEKFSNKKLQSEVQNMSFQNPANQNYEVEIQSLKQQVEDLHAQNLKVNKQNMELTQTQLAMAQLANQNASVDDLQNQIDDLKILNETLTFKNEELIQNREKDLQEKAEEYRLIIQKMEQENFSVIQHVDDRQEKEVRNQANNMDSILFETQIEELNETIRQLQYQLNTNPPNYNNQVNDSPNVVRIFKKEENHINIQEHLINQEEVDAEKEKQNEIVSLKEEVLKYKEECEKIKEQFESQQALSQQLQQEIEKTRVEQENVELNYKKHISEIESKLFLHSKEITEKQQHIEELEKSKKSLAEQVFSYEEKEKTLHKQVVEVKEQMHKIQSESQFKEKETEKRHSTSTSQIINEHEMQINKLKSELQVQQNEYTVKLQQAEQTYTTQITQLSTQIQTLTTQIEESNSQIEEKQNKIDEYVSVSKKLEERVSEMVKEREELIKHDKDTEQQTKQIKEIMEKEYKLQIEGHLSSIKKLESEIESHKVKHQTQVEHYNEQVKKQQEIEHKLKETQDRQKELELQWSNEKQQIQNENNDAQFELKSQLSDLEKVIAERTQSEHILKTDLEKYQNQLAQVATSLNQKETQLTLFKKENNTLSHKIQEIEEENNKEKSVLASALETLQTQHKELEQKYEKQVKQYERVKKEKEENDMMGNEEIQKLKMNYEALLESERHAKEEVKKEFICKVDELKIQVARHDSKTRLTDEKHQKQVKTLQKEVDGLKQLNDKKIEAMKSFQENSKKLEEEKENLEQQIKKKEQKYTEELKTAKEELEVLVSEKKKLTESQQQLQVQLTEQKQKIEQSIEIQEKLQKEVKESEQKRVNLEKEWTQKHEATIKEYEIKITEKNTEFEKILSSKQGDSSQQIQELTHKMMKQEKEQRDKENALNSKITELQSSIKEQESKIKSVEEEKVKIQTQLQEKITVFTKEIESHKMSIKENNDKIEAFEKLIKEKTQTIKNLEFEKTELEEKTVKQEEKIVLISTHLEQTKTAKKESEDKLHRKLKEKETEQNIITSDYNDKIKVYKQTIEQLQTNSRGGEINFSQDLKFSQISKITDNNNSDNGSQEHNDRFSGKDMSSRFIGGGTALSQSRASMNSQRSKEETRSMYKKLSQMSMATAAMMSVKRDYVSLKELAKSIDDQEGMNNSHHNDVDPRLTKSEIHK